MAENTRETDEIVPRIIVQSGAYNKHIAMDNLCAENISKGLKESARKGYGVLDNGGTAVDAVEAAIRVLEDNENFNAGFGSYLNNSNEVECEAMIMEGHTLNTGAVMNARYFRHPVSLARLIMEKSDHCALSGDGALEFALRYQQGEAPEVTICHPEMLISPRASKLTGKVKQEGYQDFINISYKPDGAFIQQIPGGGDTVSAVAMDIYGNLACATSTGGIAGKMKGRVGDAPLVGCGAYANEHGAATITGHGESIMKMTLAREVVSMIEKKKSAQGSAKGALDNMKTKFPAYGFGGVIAIGKRDGRNFGIASTTKYMPWASMDSRGVESGGMNPTAI